MKSLACHKQVCTVVTKLRTDLLCVDLEELFEFVLKTSECWHNYTSLVVGNKEYQFVSFIISLHGVGE